MSTELDEARNQGRTSENADTKVINCHMHLLNFAFVPNDYYDTFFNNIRWIFPLLRFPEKLVSLGVASTPINVLAKISRSIPQKITERVIKSPALFILSNGVAWYQRLVTRGLFRGHGMYRRVNQMLRLYKKYLNKLTDLYVEEMNEAKIDVALPLMMDLTYANPAMPPEVPFEYQIAVIHEQILRYPGRIWPFVMFDPRRENGVELVIEAVENLGFGGVKMYPPLGYHPVPDSPVNDFATCERLKLFYDWAEKNGVPITTHCSQGGAISDLICYGPGLQNYLTRPYNWAQVLKRHPNLVLNLAHFGGFYAKKKCAEPEPELPPSCDHLFEYRGPTDVRHKFLYSATAKGKKESQRQRARRWRNDILCLMRAYPNVYTDVSYHGMAMLNPKRYFSDLKFLLTNGREAKDADRDIKHILELTMPTDLASDVSHRILFGTDWLMTAHTWRDSEYIEAFRENLNQDQFARLASENPRRFLRRSLRQIKSIDGVWGGLGEIDGLGSAPAELNPSESEFKCDRKYHPETFTP